MQIKTIVIFFIAALLCVSAMAQTLSRTKTHRANAITKGTSGRYFARSTEGHFSVLLPAPFNDRTVEDSSGVCNIIETKTKEGIEFSVKEFKKKEKGPAVFDAITSEYSGSGNKIVNEKHGEIKGRKTFSFTVLGKPVGMVFVFIDSQDYIFRMSIVFPARYKKEVGNKFGYFFSSLDISVP